MAVEEEDTGGGIPEWVVTFGDMMSLLLTFFIMLVSLSEIKQDELYQAMVVSMRQQFGHDRSMASLSPGNSKPRSAKLAKLASMGRAMRANLALGGDKVKAPVGDHPQVRIIRPGRQARIGTVIYFDEGAMELSDEHRRDLALEADLIAGKPQKIEVRGHTSRRPSQGPKDHWDLAFARAKNTMDELVAIGIDPKRIRVSVGGKYEPLDDKGPPGQPTKQNNRVEIFLLDELTELRIQPRLPQETSHKTE